jgi:hypothetical protein
MSNSSGTSCEDLIKAASGYAKLGWPVLPLQERGKRPVTTHGVKDATTDFERIRAWWQERPLYNLGLAVPTGFVVLDLDTDEALQALRAQDLLLPTTVHATTGRGQHLWYATGKAAVRNRVGVFPGVDVRAPGGYVVAPPSVHPNGTSYRWVVDLDPGAITECPEWLLACISSEGSSIETSAETWHRRITEQVPEGSRNQALAEVAGLLFRRLPADVAAEFAHCWALVKLRPPLSEREMLQTINSIAGCELRRQGGRRWPV